MNEISKLKMKLRQHMHLTNCLKIEKELGHNPQVLFSNLFLPTR